jgi:hypothetical protein
MAPTADLRVVTRPGAVWLLTAPPGAPDVWLRARVVDADRAAVLLEAGDGSPRPAPGTRLVGGHGAGDGMRRFEVTVRRHVPGTRDRLVVSTPTSFVHVERRAGERIPLRLDAELVIGVGGGEIETIRATTVDVSVAGAGVLSPQPLRAGRRLLVLLHLDDGSTVLAGGVVAAQRMTARGGVRLGLDLQFVDPADRERLEVHLAAASS